MNRRFLTVCAFSVLAACSRETTQTSESTSPPPATPVTTDTGATSAPAAAASSASGPCASITEAEGTSIMGHTMKFGQGTQPADCLLVSAAGDQTKSISFQIQPGTDMYQQMASSGQGEPLSGVGEKATVLNNMVVAVKGGRTYLGGVYDGAAPATMKAKSIELAKKVTARM